MAIRSLTRLTVPLVVLLVAGCGGKTAGLSASSPNCQVNVDTTNPTQPAHYTTTCADAGAPSPDADSPPPDGGTIIGDDAGGRCVHVEPDELTTSCASDSDCTLVATGDICDGQCDCGGTTPVNTAGAALYESLITSLTTEPCHCAAAGFPECISGECTYCPTGPGTCTGAIDGGVILSTDAGPPPSDASVACVNLDPTEFSTSCTVDSDCFNALSGSVCDGECDCPSTPMSTSSEAAYEEAIQGISLGECGCPAYPSPVCNSGQCMQAELTGG